MEGEIANLTKIWITVSVSLTYCYFISTRTPKGITRLVFFLPIISLFLTLPLLASSVFFQFFVGLFIAWYANFRLLLFALYRDDHLPTDSSTSLLSFVLLISLPINIKHVKANYENNPTHSRLEIVVYILLWLFTVQSFLTTMPTIVKQTLYALRMCLTEQLVFTVAAVLAKPFLEYEFEPQFVNPYFPTSVQNFWGKRWNLFSSALLKSSVYEPTRSLLTPVIGRRWALHPAVVVTFAVSGLMHEVFYFYVTQQRPTWEALLFFLVNGVWVAIEIELKKKGSQFGWHLDWKVSVPLTVSFVICTGTYLCWTELFHCGAGIREIEEYAEVVSYVKSMLI